MFSLAFHRQLRALGYSEADAQRMCDECDYDDRAAVIRSLTEPNPNDLHGWQY